MSKFRAFCKEWLTWLSQQIFQYTCPVCRTTTLYERGICPGCLAMLAVEEKRTCPRCHRIAPECTCALSVPAVFPMGDKGRTWLAHTFYDSYEDGVLRKLLHNAKKDYKRAMFDYMASMLVADLNKMYQSDTHAMAFDDAANPWRNCSIAWIPRSDKGFREYGFDQGEECATRIAKQLGIPALPLFLQCGGKTQKKLSAAERRENAEHNLHLRRDLDLPTGPLLLYDDVITTGSSMTSAILLLAEEGVTDVFPIAFARTVRGKRRLQAETESNQKDLP